MDRPYGPVLNFLHHGIGSTHVCHHVNSAIPHYNAWKGTALLRQRFPIWFATTQPQFTELCGALLQLVEVLFIKTHLIGLSITENH
ncbi:MAG: hypothetical protein CM15mP77_4280 [Synechococcus sp.]|nr:MAG: hypothetical protein CM15mP77_4280 [Synechococcus sp.]